MGRNHFSQVETPTSLSGGAAPGRAPPDDTGEGGCGSGTNASSSGGASSGVTDGLGFDGATDGGVSLRLNTHRSARHASKPITTASAAARRPRASLGGVGSGF